MFSKQGVVKFDSFCEYEQKQFQGALWLKIFDHNNNAGTVVFANQAEALLSTTEDKFSRLCLLSNLKSSDGKYEFLLEYPDDRLGQYNRWIQTSNPTVDSIAGYTAIHIDWAESSWGGLAPSTSTTRTFIDGSPGAGSWWYAIGAYTKYTDGGKTGIPGNSPPSVTGRAQLWVRIDNVANPKLNLQITKSNDIISNEFYEN